MVAALGLKQFLHRKEVLDLYRAIVRDIHRLPTKDQAELMDYVRSQFKIDSGSLDSNKYMLSKGRREYETMARGLGLSS